MQEMLRSLVMAFWADGGQGTARRNAWVAMVADSKRARERADADASVTLAIAGHAVAGVPTAANG
jgi:hypothetical protein